MGIQVVDILYYTLEVYKWILLIRVLISYVKPDADDKVTRFMFDITDPLIKPARRILPPIAGMDFSPVLVFLLVALVQYVFLS